MKNGSIINVGEARLKAELHPTFLYKAEIKVEHKVNSIYNEVATPPLEGNCYAL